MAAPTGAALQVQVSANIDKFTKQMRETGAIADRAVHDIEDKFSRANPSIGGGFFGGLAKGALSGLLSGVAIERLGRAIFDANREMANLDVTSRRVGVSLDKLQQFRFATSAGGVDPKLMDETLQSLAKQVNDLTRFSNQESALGKFAKDNNITLRDRNGILISTEELLLRIANIVSDTKREQDKIELAKRLNIPVEILKVLEQSAQHIKDMGVRAKEVGAILTDDVINQAVEFDKKWNLAWAAFTVYGKAALLNIGNGIGFLIDGFTDRLVDAARQAKTTKWTPSASQITGPAPVSGGGSRSTTTPTGGIDTSSASIIQRASAAASDDAARAGKLAFERQMEIERTLVIEGMKTQSDAVFDSFANAMRAQNEARTKELQKEAAAAAAESADRNDPTKAQPNELRVDVDKRRPRQPAVLRGEEDEKVKAAKDRLEAYILALMRQEQVEKAIAATIGQSNAVKLAAIEIAKAQVDLNLLDEKSRAAIIQRITEQVAKTEALREANAAAMRAQQGIIDASRFFGELTLDVFDKLIEGGAKFEDILQDIAKSIAKAALQAALLGSGPLAGLFGTGPTTPGGVGGIIGALISGFGGARAIGGPVTAGRTYLVGEKGPEFFKPMQGGRITPNSVFPQALTPSGGSSYAPTYVIDARSSERGVEQKIVAALTEYDRMLLPRIQEKQLRVG